MRDESLKKLDTAFRNWRSEKRRRSEGTPPALLARAKRAAAVHGVGNVARLLGVEKKHLTDAEVGRPRKSRKSAALPAFSRLDVGGVSGRSPLVEIETPRGQKVRLFSVTPETLELLSSFFGDGGGA